MSTQWMHGAIKAVQSGDTLVVMGTQTAAIPPSKTITLASLVSPKLGRSGVSPDEEFAWEAREFLRKKFVGKRCVFRIDYTLENIPGREFGTIFVDKENLAVAVVQQGFAKVREGGTKQSPYMEQLLAAQTTAQTEGLGVFAKDTETRRNSIRELKPGSGESGFDGPTFLKEHKQGAKFKGVVEAVLNGTTLRVYLTNLGCTLTTLTCGVVSPSMRKMVDGVSTGPEKYAQEARFYTELKALNRDVDITLQGLDQYNNLFCTVTVYETDGTSQDLGMMLAKSGWANFNQRTSEYIAQQSIRNELRKTVQGAKENKLNMWKNYVPQESNMPKENQNFKGVVVEVVSGDTVVVKNKATGKEVRMSLASIRAPRQRTQSNPNPEPHAADAKEFLRKKIIGKDVTVSLEYTRKVPAPPGQPENSSNTVIQFGNVAFQEKLATGETVVSQAAESVVRNGYATIIRGGRDDESSSSIIDQLVDAEKLAMQQKLGTYGKESVPPRTNDVSQQGSAQKAKQYLPFFQKSGSTTAMVDQVINGHRYRLVVPSQSVTIVFSPSGIRTPQRTSNAPPRPGQKPIKPEPFGDEAYSFVRELINQRSVEIQIEQIDRMGTFLGSLSVTKNPREGPVNIGVALLENGLAKLIPQFSADRVRGGDALTRAQQSAIDGKIRIWKDYDPSSEVVEDLSEDMPMSNGAQQEKKEVRITELQDATCFYIQMDDSKIAAIEKQIKELNLDSAEKSPGGYVKGQMVMAKFSADEQWYRGYIEEVQKQGSAGAMYGVYFLDYGNRERLHGDRLRPLKGAVATTSPQAFLCKLAYLTVPEYEEEFGFEAATEFNNYTSGKKLVAQIERRERIVGKDKHPETLGGRLHVLLKEAADEEEYGVHAKLLTQGLGVLPNSMKVRNPRDREMILKMQKFQDDARRFHKGMFRYGDPDDSDEE